MPFLGIESTPEDLARQEAIGKRANTVFILSLVSILFCCVGGIAASIVASRAKNDAAAGQLDSAESQTNIAIILMVLSFLLGVGSFVGQLTRLQ